MDFQFFTRGSSSPQGKPRVYFTAHPDDYEKCFDEIEGEILSRHNCAIFYLDGDARPDEVEDYVLRLGEMQLFVVPVTTKLLTTPSRAMDVDIPFALAHHIPVLPLMQERGLDELFTARFGDLQYLDKNDADPTSIGYDEKLMKYLESVIVGDNLAKAVRAEFDAYIFLSYRKKDRRYAQQLMRLIHAEPAFRDVAIWYDEFLTPGESFNHAIRDALEKSTLVALTVTPNLINEINYILTTEYPTAKELGKDILPAEMLPTDRVKLSAMYRGIPEPAGEAEVIQRLRMLLSWVKKEHTPSPPHDLMIGLAYLSGIDVEKDHEKAVGLITSSAEAGFIPAISKLASMYSVGEGVRRDHVTAASWKERLVEELIAVYHDRAPVLKAAKDIVDVLFNLGDTYILLHRAAQAERVYRKAAEYCGSFYETYRDEYFTAMRIASYVRLGDIARMEGRYDEAKEYLLKELAVVEKMQAQQDMSYLLFVLYRALGTVAFDRGRFDEAQEYYQKQIGVCKKAAEETDDPEAWVGLSDSYQRLGSIAQEQGRYEEAERYYSMDLEIIERLASESGSVEDRDRLAESNTHMCYVKMALKQFPKAREYAQRALEIYDAVARETESVDAKYLLSSAYLLLGDAVRATNDPEEAHRFYLKALRTGRKVAKTADSLETSRLLASAYRKLGVTCGLRRRLPEAREYYENALEILERLAQEKGIIKVCHDLILNYLDIGDIAVIQRKLDEARRYFERAVQLGRRLVKETGTVKARQDLADAYLRLGEVYEKLEKQADAQEPFREGLMIFESLSNEVGSIDIYSSLALACYHLGRLTKDGELLDHALGIWSQLSEICPDVPQYRENTEVTFNLIQDLFGG